MAFYFTQSRGGMSNVSLWKKLLRPLIGLEKLASRSTDSNGGASNLSRVVSRNRRESRAWLRCRLIVSDSSSLTLELLLLHWPDDAGHWEFGEAQPGISVRLRQERASKKQQG